MTTDRARDRARRRADAVRLFEQRTRAVAATEQLLARQRAELAEARDELIALVGGRCKRPEVSEAVMAAARAVDAAPAPVSREDVARALNVTNAGAGQRLARAVAANLVDRVGRDRYTSPGRASAPVEEVTQPQ